MKTPRLHLALALPLLAVACDGTEGPTSPTRLASGPHVAGAPANAPTPGVVEAVGEFSANLAAPHVTSLAAVQAKSQTTHVSSINARLGVPTVMWTVGGSAPSLAFATPAEAARVHLGAHAALYNLPEASLQAARVDRVHDIGRGAIVVTLEQSMAGLDIHGTAMKLVLDRDNRLVAIGGHLHPAARADALPPAPTMSDAEAVDRVIEDIAGGGVQILTERVKPVLYPLTKSLELSKRVEVEVAAANSSDSRAYAYVIADDGRILERQNRTFSESFDYRVWADTAAPFTPLDGPQGDVSPHPTGVPGPFEPQFVAPSLISMEGFNTNPEGGADPWLAANATVTSGNNVDAYADHSGPDGFGPGDTRADTNSPRGFDYIFDPTISPFASSEQIKASVVQIFYTINWLHDFYYDSGFNESARVAQNDNYGRGPGGGDALRAEAQDTRGEARNNANMSTLSDGIPPRMQMYVWNGPVEAVGETRLTITAPAAIAGEYPAQASSFGVDAEVTAVGSMSLTAPANGCGSISTGLAGQVAVIDRGECTFVEKAQNAVARGAAAVIIVNNLPGSPNALPPLGGNDTSLTVPVLGVSFADGDIFKAALGGGAVNADTSRAGRVRGPDRDGTVDNAIVAHEWGHYFHHRLSFCGGTQQCGAMSEGWGDFMSVQLVLREGDDLDGVYGVPSFVSSDPYFGIRRVPYSVNFEKNALTFKHIGDDAGLPSDLHPMRVFGPNSEVHNAGEIWTTMLTEAYVALLRDDRHTFAEAQRRFSDTLVAGLLASPANGTFTEVRDSILAAAAATDADDMLVLAQAFARRGAGSGAQSPPRSSQSMNGVVESYDVAGNIGATALGLAGDLDCDADKNWDAGETARVQVNVTNTGPLPLTDSIATLVADNPAVTFPEGATVAIDRLAGFETKTLEVLVALADDVAGMERVRFDVTVENSESLTAEVSTDVSARINLDDIAANSSTDDVESRIVTWTAATDVTSIDWVRAATQSADNTVWRGVDPSTRVDMRLESPPLQVGDEPLVITLEHRHQFEQSDGVNWDGGVIELSSDGGATWTDIGGNVAGGYGGALTTDSDNPLGGRQAFVGESNGYPAMTTATLNLGTVHAGSAVQIRFRIGSDQAVGGAGWDIDNLVFEGITNRPFATLGDDVGDCDDIGGGEPDEGGCGCRGAGSSGGGALVFMVLVAVLWRRRRLALGQR